MFNNTENKHKFKWQVRKQSKTIEIVTMIIRNVSRLSEDSSIWLERESQLGLGR